MSRISVNDASREDLIAIVRQLHQQITRQRQQAAAAAAGGTGGADVDELIELRARLATSTDQVKLLRRELSEKNNEIRALTEQNVLLSKKSAGDEETINVLIKQLEEIQIRMSASEAAVMEHKQVDENESHFAAMQRAPSPRSGSMEQQPRPRGASVSTSTGETTQAHSGFVATVAGTPVSKTAPGIVTATARGRVEPESSSSMVKGSVAGSGGNTVDMNRVASMSAALERKKEEIASLQEKVRELEEVNSLYTAIVLQHDEEEKNRLQAFKKAMRVDGKEAGDVSSGDREKDGAQVSEEHTGIGSGGIEEGILASAQWLQQTQSLQHALRKVEERNEHMERECADLRTMLRQSEREVAVRTQSVETMQADMIKLQLELVALERWIAARKDDIFSGDRPRQLPTDEDERTARSSSVQGDTGKLATASSRAAGDEAAPRVGERTRAQVMYTRQRTTSTAASAITLPTTRDILNTSALPAITIRNPSKSETMLLARIQLLEDHVRQTEEFEEDRQRSFNDMEKYRAEMFVNMNSELEKQRKEIQKLVQEKTQLEKRAVTAGTPSEVVSASPNTTGTTVVSQEVAPKSATEPNANEERTQEGHSPPQSESAAVVNNEQTHEQAIESADTEDKDEALLRELETSHSEHIDTEGAEDEKGALAAVNTQRAPVVEKKSEATAGADSTKANENELHSVVDELRAALEENKQMLAAAKLNEERLIAEKADREGRVRNIVAAVGELRKKEKDAALQISELEEQLRTACVISEQSSLEQSKGTWDFDSLLEAYGVLLGAYLALVASGTARCLDLDELTERNVSDLDAIMRAVQYSRKSMPTSFPEGSDAQIASHSSRLSASSRNASSYSSSPRHPNESTHTTVMRTRESPGPTSYQYPAQLGDLASSGLGSGEYGSHTYEMPGGSGTSSPMIPPSGIPPSPPVHGYHASQPQPMPYLAPSVGMMQSSQYAQSQYMVNQHHNQHQQQQLNYPAPSGHHHYEVNDYDQPKMTTTQRGSQNTQPAPQNVLDSLFGGYYSQPQQPSSSASGTQNAYYASPLPPSSNTHGSASCNTSNNGRGATGGGGGTDTFQASFDPFA